MIMSVFQVAKQWYDYERNTFKFIQHFKENSEPLTFTYDHDFDENGIVYWIGTNAKYVVKTEFNLLDRLDFNRLPGKL